MDDERLFEILRDAPIKQEKEWNCVDWVVQAIEMACGDRVLEGVRLNLLGLLMMEALRAADAEVVRREGVVRALL